MTRFEKIYRTVFKQLRLCAAVIVIPMVLASTWSLFTGSDWFGNSEVVKDDMGWGSAALNVDHDQTGTWSLIGVANACGLGASSCFKCHNGKRAKKWSEDPETAPWHPNHKKINFSCTGCHKGNPRLLDRSLAHAELIINPRLVPDRCETCHVSGKPVPELLKQYNNLKLAAKQTDFKKVVEQEKKETAKQDDAPSVARLTVNKIAESPTKKNKPTKVPPIKKPSIKIEPQKTLAMNLSQAAKCFTLGPFRDLGKLRSLTHEIKAYVIETNFREHEEKKQLLYWVYIKPEKNQKKAIETGKRLKAKKIKDFYVIRNGEKINGLSLGHFKNKRGAYRLMKRVKNLGFNVVVEPVFKTYTLYWLDYQVTSGARIPESIFDRHLRQAKKNNIRRLSRDCGALF